METPDIVQTIHSRIHALNNLVAQDMLTVGYVTMKTRTSLQSFLCHTSTWPFRVQKDSIVDDDNCIIEPIIPENTSCEAPTDFSQIMLMHPVTVPSRASDERKTLKRENPLDLGS